MMSKEKRRVPKLRFPGFTEDWEQRKLNEFLSVSNLKNAENKYNKKDVLSVSGDYGIVNQIDFQGRSFAGASVSNYGVVEKGDIVYTKSPLKLNPYGIIKTNRLNNGIVSTLYAIYKTKENCDSKFIEHYFNLDSRLNQYLKPLVNKGAKNDMKVSSENALIGEVCFPKITEQVLIADLLDCLDIYITLHQRKLDNIKLKKKALLQKLFPKNGERYPELRFPGFTDAWEQCKLGDIATLSKGNGYSKSDLSASGNPIILYGRLYTNYETTIRNVDTFVKLKDKSVISQGGEVIVPASGETAEDISRASVVKNQGVIIGGDLNVIKVNILLDPTFLALTISNGEQQKELSKRAQGKSVVHLHNSDLQEVNLIFPLLNEQRKISTLFEKMDNIITLHQRKLDHLQLQKKALLQQMFV